MSQQLINHNPDLKRLRDEGFSVRIVSGHLVLEHIPYVNSNRQVALGMLVSTLQLSGDKTDKPTQHVAMFSGGHPCKDNGSKLEAITHSSGRKQITPELHIDHSFSSKPRGGYEDYFHKMSTYAEIISFPARKIDPSATARPHLPFEDHDNASVFRYEDTASSRAGITAISQKLNVPKVAIVGLGGTGSYILDLIAKTPIDEIHLFDGDVFSSHNAFRAPGAANITELHQRPKKADYFQQKYNVFRDGIVPHPYYLNETNLELLDSMQYVFLSMDGSDDKASIITHLESTGIPFIDTGIGVQEIDSVLGGILRVTTCSPAKSDHVQSKISYGGGRDNPYDTNIQVADLNALNACLAVIKWKKMLGFYRDHEREHHSLYTIDGNHLLNEDSP